MNGWDTDYRDPDELAAAQRWLDEVYGQRPGLAETPRGLLRFLPGLLAGVGCWAALLWLLGRVGPLRGLHLDPRLWLVALVGGLALWVHDLLAYRRAVRAARRTGGDA